MIYDDDMKYAWALPWDITLTQLAITILCLTLTSIYFLKVLHDDDNLEQQSNGIKLFIMLFWLFPFASIVIWFILRSPILLSDKFIAMDPNSSLYICCTLTSRWIQYALCVCMEKYKRKHYLKLKKALIHRCVYIQLANGLINIIIVEILKVRSQALESHLLFIGMMEMILVIWEHCQNLENCCDKQRAKEMDLEFDEMTHHI